MATVNFKHIDLFLDTSPVHSEERRFKTGKLIRHYCNYSASRVHECMLRLFGIKLVILNMKLCYINSRSYVSSNLYDK
jgi:hypothetical protein